MEKLKDPSLSLLPDKNESKQPTSSSSINEDANTEIITKYATLMEELQDKTNDFVAAVYTPKTVLTKAGKIQVKPLLPVAYKKIDDFIAASDAVIKWYEAETERCHADSLLYKSRCAEAHEKMKQLQETINDQKDTIDLLTDNSATLSRYYKERMKSMEEAFKQMKAAEEELHAKIALMEHKEKVSNEKLEEMKAQRNTVDETSNCGRQEDDIPPAAAKAESNDNNNFVQLQDVIVNGNINYKLLRGKVLAITKLKTANGGFEVYYNDGNEERKVKLELNDSFKVHFTGEICFNIGYIGYLLKILRPHVVSCSLTSLSLDAGVLGFNDFLMLAKSRSIEHLHFGCSVDDGHSHDLPLEKMLEFFPNLKTFDYSGKPNCCKKTAATLLQLPVFQKLERFELQNCSYFIDLAVFGQFMKKHSFAQFSITFERGVSYASNATIFKFQQEKDAIVRSWPTDAPKPEINL